jgi:hypothetical protein
MACNAPECSCDAAICEAIGRIAYEAHHLREDIAALKRWVRRATGSIAHLCWSRLVGFSRTFSRDWREFLNAMDASDRFGFYIAAE